MPVSVGEMLAAHLVRRGGAGATLLGWTARPWASATFEGQLLRVELQLAEEHRVGFVSGIEEAEFPLRRHFVADLAARTEDRETLVVDALVIAEG